MILYNKQKTIRNLNLLIEGWKEFEQDPKMTSFGGIEFSNKQNVNTGEIIIGEINDCGTNCCILGLGPSIEGLEIQDTDFNSDDDFDYELYSDRLFPSMCASCWNYLFGGFWEDSREQFFLRAEKVLSLDLKLTDDMRKEMLNSRKF